MNTLWERGIGQRTMVLSMVLYFVLLFLNEHLSPLSRAIRR